MELNAGMDVAFPNIRPDCTRERFMNPKSDMETKMVLFVIIKFHFRFVAAHGGASELLIQVEDNLCLWV